MWMFAGMALMNPINFQLRPLDPHTAIVGASQASREPIKFLGIIKLEYVAIIFHIILIQEGV